MSLYTPLTFTLKQTKVFTGVSPRSERFAVQSVIAANPVGLDGTSNPDGAFAANAFIMGPGGGVDSETYIGMINLSKPEDLALPINPLNCFRDLDTDLSAYGPGHTLIIRGYLTPPPGIPTYTMPGEWTPETGTVDDPQSFVVAAADGANDRTVISGVFPWATANLCWQMFSPASVLVASGTRGVTERQQTGLSRWRDRRLTVGFYEVVAALDHMTSVQTYLKSIAKQANLDASAYLTWPPGNPVVNTY